MCLYVNKVKTKNKPKTVRNYYKVVKCAKGRASVSAPYRGGIILSGWYEAVNLWGTDLSDASNLYSINDGAIHVCTTKREADKLVKYNESGEFHVIKVKCYPEDFIAYGTMSAIRAGTGCGQAAYSRIFIQEDDLRAIIKKQNR